MDDIVIAFVELDIGFVRSVRIKTSAPMAKEYWMGYERRRQVSSFKGREEIVDLEEILLNEKSPVEKKKSQWGVQR
uniref:Uncharacterized protein n=1 Tax=Vespula pensylvanica TaxID=30213 RepID=A0A834P567_VESPE|nr:hypothetical protein H0235_005736 [Vespula pensylvanica]